MSRHHRPARMGLARAGMFVAALTMLGNGLGLLRDVVLAGVYGANADTDAYVAAWTVPETFSPLLMEGLLPIVLTPWLVRHARSRKELGAAGAAALIPVSVASGVLAALIVMFAPTLVQLLTPEIADPDLAVLCVRLAAGTVPAMAVAGVMVAVLRSGHALVTPAVVYAAYNLGIIGCILIGGQRWGIAAAAVGLTVGAVLMCLLQLPALMRVVAVSRPLRVDGSSARAAVLVVVPTLAYLLLRQSQVFVERNIGSRLGEGAVTYLNLAQKLGQLPVTLTLALALVAFPALARLGHEGRRDEAAALITSILGIVVAVLITATFGAVFSAHPLVTVAFGRGAFQPDAVHQTAQTLAVYSLGLVAQGVVTTCVLALFALHRRSWTPALQLALCLAATVVAAMTLAERFGPPGIAGANALGIWVAAVGLLVVLTRQRLAHPAQLMVPTTRIVLVNLLGIAGHLATVQLLPAEPLVLLAAYLGWLVVGFVLVGLFSRGALRRDLFSFRITAPGP